VTSHNRAEAIEIFRGVPLFRALSKRDLNEIAKSAKLKSAQSGAALTREGEPGREFFVMLHGKATVRRKGRKLRSLSIGDCFGEISLINPGVRTATVQTDTDVEVLTLDSRAFQYLLNNVEGLPKKLLVSLCKYLQTENAPSDFF